MKTADILVVDLVVLLIVRNGKYFVAENKQWGGLTLPMKKIDQPVDINRAADRPAGPRIDVAAYGFLETWGRPVGVGELTYLEDFQPRHWQQSGRDGKFKNYRFQVFSIEPEDEPRPPRPVTHYWVALDELGTLEPVSPSVELILSDWERHQKGDTE